MKGATTREIAIEAGLSEMTLFRRFGTKEKLLSAVVERFFQRQVEPPPPVQQSPADLRSRLLHYAKLQHRLTVESLPIIRVLLGELHHFSRRHREVLSDVFKPMRSATMALLGGSPSKTRAERPEIEMMLDMLEGIIFVDALRRASGQFHRYSAQRVLETAVDMLLLRLERPAVQRASRQGK